jgi:hypothetical protein
MAGMRRERSGRLDMGTPQEWDAQDFVVTFQGPVKIGRKYAVVNSRIRHQRLNLSRRKMARIRSRKRPMIKPDHFHEMFVGSISRSSGE